LEINTVRAFCITGIVFLAWVIIRSSSSAFGTDWQAIASIFFATIIRK
jgi:hypothetical protein